MLARAHRLTEGQHFAAAIRRGRRAGGGTLVLHLGSAAAGEDHLPRVGLVVGRTVGGAVVRNQVKRRLRHLARERLDSLPGDAHLVIRALPASAGAPSARLAADLDAALSRLRGAGAPR